MYIISPLESNITGKILIEASAGTGKTYTITSLVIRYLLLGINPPDKNNNISNPLRLEDILIVTFTKAATAELRIRIYDRIIEAQKAFKTGHSDDVFIQDILALINKNEYIKARSILNDAERSMSDANIFTIHSFCQRFLKQNPLDSQLPFDAKLDTSDAELKSEAAKQFWRETCYYFSDRLAQVAAKIYKNPNDIENNISKFLSIAHELNTPNNIEDLEIAVFDCQGEDDALDQVKIQSLLWSFAAKKFNQIFTQLKEKNGLLFFDDLISETEKLISNATPEQLAKIRERYKVALIDEFQDTDRQQYKIFSEIFGKSEDRSLLMIGDPKQSIYKFRGADIDTYLQAKHTVDHQYALGTNYRSGTSVVQGVNELFTQTPNPFLAEDIPFHPVDTPEKSAHSYIAIDGAEQKGVGIAYIDEDINKGNFTKSISKYITNRIQQLLASGKIHDSNLAEARSIDYQDITILVRSKGDAEPLLATLRNAGLPAVYLSDKSKVFESPAAKTLVLFLKSLLESRNQELMKQSFASFLYQLSLNELHELLMDQDNPLNSQRYEEFLIEREQCLQEWSKQGIIPMMDQFLHRHHRIHRLRNQPDFDRLMTDLRHLCEILQTQSLLMPTKEALVEWFTNQMTETDASEDELGGGSNSLRLESERNVITIMTIHASKGLEFPITFIPSNLETGDLKPPFIVASDDGSKTIDYNKEPKNFNQLLHNEYAENMRLFYVALTRAKYYCEFSLAKNFLSGTAKKNINHQTVFSTLFGTEENEPFSLELISKLKNIQILPTHEQIEFNYVADVVTNETLTAVEFTGKINRAWNISSFTQLTKEAPSSYFAKENQDESNVKEEDLDTAIEPVPSIFTFPKGANTGTFIHALFEKHAPKDLLDKEYLHKILSKTFFSEAVSNNLDVWVNVMHDWLSEIFNNELLPDVTFADVLQKDSLHELEFLFPVKPSDTNPTGFTANVFNRYLQQYRHADALPELSFYTLNGMMKGFIDLIFMHNGKYYIVDYKTNYLGGQIEDYNEPALHQAMLESYYDVQYLLYSVALMRYLKFRLPNFNYDENFGGVFYLFVRGMDQTSSHGIYFRKPSEESILQLDQLMGNDHE